mmetsp:Transcript_24205/g.80422  ORF Transcript_24205/g.80422 Transcript_24205/m.80422 type:complete len:387 (-) Transcript_24205:1494-2654(-)
MSARLQIPLPGNPSPMSGWCRLRPTACMSTFTSPTRPWYPSPWPTTRRAARLMEQGGRSSPKSPPELLTPHLATMQRTIGSVGCCLFPAAKAWNLPPSLGRLCCSLVRWTEAVTVWGLSRWGFSRHSRHSSRSSNSSHRHSCCTVGSAGRMTGFPRRQLPAHPPCWWWLLAADLWSRTRPGRSRCLAWTRRPKLLRASAASSAAGSTCYPPSSSSLPRPPPLSWGSTAAPPTPKRGRGPAICASPSYPRRRRRPCLLSCRPLRFSPPQPCSPTMSPRATSSTCSPCSSLSGLRAPTPYDTASSTSSGTASVTRPPPSELCGASRRCSACLPLRPTSCLSRRRVAAAFGCTPAPPLRSRDACGSPRPRRFTRSAQPRMCHPASLLMR